MVIVDVLVFAGVDECFEEFHAEVVDVVGIFVGVEKFPVFDGIGIGIFEDFFSLVDESFACHFVICYYRFDLIVILRSM